MSQTAGYWVMKGKTSDSKIPKVKILTFFTSSSKVILMSGVKELITLCF